VIRTSRSSTFVNTHCHIDHSSGLRAAVAEGATILTHQLNKAYHREDTQHAAHAQSDKAQQNGKKRLSKRSARRKC